MSVQSVTSFQGESATNDSASLNASLELNTQPDCHSDSFPEVVYFEADGTPISSYLPSIQSNSQTINILNQEEIPSVEYECSMETHAQEHVNTQPTELSQTSIQTEDQTIQAPCWIICQDQNALYRFVNPMVHQYSPS